MDEQDSNARALSTNVDERFRQAQVLLALQGGDVGSLCELLRSDREILPFFRCFLANMIDPNARLTMELAKGVWPKKLKLVKNGRGRPSLYGDFALQIGREVDELVSSGLLRKQIYHRIGLKHDLSESRIKAIVGELSVVRLTEATESTDK